MDSLAFQIQTVAHLAHYSSVHYKTLLWQEKVSGYFFNINILFVFETKEFMLINSWSALNFYEKIQLFSLTLSMSTISQTDH